MPAASAETFLLPAGSGFRFCLLRKPLRRSSVRGCVILAPPFAEELNKSRRTMALAAEGLAAFGFAVLQIDCLGCGDSSGDFADATWEEWISDIERGYRWMSEHFDGRVWIWGVRAGALLATELLKRLERSPALLLWQPVLSGRQHLTRFLRLKSANEFLGDGPRSGTQELFKRLADREAIEVAGYRITPELADGLAAAELSLPPGFKETTVCLEVVAETNGDFDRASAACFARWRECGVTLISVTVAGPSFWQTQQITEAPALVEATCRHLAQAAR